MAIAAKPCAMGTSTAGFGRIGRCLGAGTTAGQSGCEPAKQADPYLAARIKEETDAGIVIRGCRMLATLPISDEIMVFPSTLLKSAVEDAPYAFGFSHSQ